VTNTTPFINIPHYPEVQDVMNEIKKLPRFVAIDADRIAKEIGNAKASNMVMLGAASPFIDIDFEKIRAGVKAIFERKGEEVVALNIRALEAGREFALQNNKTTDLFLLYMRHQGSFPGGAFFFISIWLVGLIPSNQVSS